MRTLLRSITWSGLALASLSLVSPLDAQDDLTRRDRLGAVSVELTLLAKPDGTAPVRIKLTLDTHSADLDTIALQQAVVLQAADGSLVRPTAVEQVSGGGHHRQATLVFPALAAGTPVRVVLRGVGGMAERAFVWDVAR